MTEQEFDTRIKEIDAEYDRNREGADAKRDQELARLFIQAKEGGLGGQEWIAKKMGKSQKWVSTRLLFGRYLRFIPGGYNSSPPPHPLTERRFRDNWSRSGKRKKETENERFARVQELIEADRCPLPKNYDHLVKKPGIKPAVIKILSDGTRRNMAQITALVQEAIPEAEADQKSVQRAVLDLKDSPPRGMAFDARHDGRNHKYRLIKTKREQFVKLDPEKAGAMAGEALPLVKEVIDIFRQPEVGRPITLAIDHLSKVRRMLERLLAEGKPLENPTSLPFSASG